MIITTAANDLVAPFHERMPAILGVPDFDLWLNPAVKGADRIRPLLRTYPPDKMAALRVSKAANSPTHETAKCVESADT